MKKGITFLAIRLVLLLVCTNGWAADINPNGFPSGEHYNLNIHGKKAEFSCPDQEFDTFGDPVYGNSIFVPEQGDGEIFIESGKGKKAALITELQVTDPCAFDNNGATFKLPPNSKGYRVYARALAKPTDEPTIDLASSLYMVEDENGNDLLYLGLVTDQGFETPTASLTRQKGKSKAVEISGMFQWNGTVCYYDPPVDGYDYSQNYCCIDSDLDGMYDSCDPLSEEIGFCPADYTEMTAYCKTFNAEWIFNIADYISMLMETSNNGVKLLQIRFYPN